MPSRPIDLPTLPCSCASLRRATRAVTQLYDEELRPLGLRATQFTLLQTLATAGEISQGGLGRILALDSTTLTRTLAPLQQHGWAKSRPGADRRERLYSLTREGQAVLEEARPLWERAQDRLRSSLGEPEWEALQQLLDRTTVAALGA
ncbi:MAG TPA: MarR family transcriptional regulator [Thermoanaerobaculia bacterium]|nr:MarR family transcriptional regulator [Thermoanaerobaculia bacterium]